MKRAIRFVANLYLVCFVGSLTITQLNGQQTPPEEIQPQTPTSELVAPVAPVASPPRIRYRDVIKQLSDSMVGLRQDLAKTTLRLEEITKENDSIKKMLDVATPEALQTIGQKNKKNTSDGLSFISVLVLIISLVALGGLAVIFRFSKLDARRKEIKYKELYDEFENYRRSSRERFEKQAIDHFNELKKLKKI